MENNLFEEFKPNTKAQWIEQATNDLKGKDFNQVLVSETLDGIKIQPFYTAEDANGFHRLKAYQNSFHPAPEIPGLSPRLWSNVFFVNGMPPKEGNKLILDALMNGCDALYVEVSEKTDFESLLKDVEIQYLGIYLCPSSGINPLDTLNNFLDWLKNKGVNKNALNGGFLWDGVSSLLREGGILKDNVSIVKSLLENLSDFPNFSALSINFSVYHEAGGSALEELKYAFSAYIELLDHLTETGVEPESIFKNTMLHFSVGSRYFEEISKIRTARIFFDALAALYAVHLNQVEVKVFCQSSNWTKSRLDVYTNMLRNTSEGMAAILGGCNALWIRPHDEVTGMTTAFSQRMARNISNILKEETYLDKVMDPVAGSYFVESLTSKMLEKLKSELQEIEAMGGWRKIYEDQSLQLKVKTRRKQRQEAVLSGDVVKIGANKFRQDKEALSFNVSEAIHEAAWQLLPARETELLEEKARKSS